MFVLGNIGFKYFQWHKIIGIVKHEIGPTGIDHDLLGTDRSVHCKRISRVCGADSNEAIDCQPLERGIFIAKLMAAVLRSGPDLELLLEPVLEISDSVMTHRRRYFAEPRLASTLDVLVRESANPRSLAFQTASLENHAAALPTGANPEGVAVVQRRVSQLAAQLRLLEEGVAHDDAPGVSRAADLLSDFAAGLGELSDLLTQVCFSHVTPQVN